MKRKLKRAAVLLFLFIAVTNLLYLSFDIAADDAALVIPRHITEHLPLEGGCFLAPFLTALLTALTASPLLQNLRCTIRSPTKASTCLALATGRWTD
ncbi:hypothetical protein TcBrA4_0032590 [Trypanosoma cruzi]|nr:hypothetical protein TcBrA4_0032590 [Trypanosoma cruzi]